MLLRIIGVPIGYERVDGKKYSASWIQVVDSFEIGKIKMLRRRNTMADRPMCQCGWNWIFFVYRSYDSPRQPVSPHQGRIYIYVAGDFCVCLILARIVVSRQACAVRAAEITLSFSVSSRCTLQLLQARDHRFFSALFFPPFLFLPPFSSVLSFVFSVFLREKKQRNRRSPRRFRACV